jgi:hypothetical protein
VNVDITKDAAFVDHEDGPFGVTFGAQHAVTFCYPAMRPEIAEQRIMTDAAQAICPGFQTWDMVYADTQNLGV